MDWIFPPSTALSTEHSYKSQWASDLPHRVDTSGLQKSISSPQAFIPHHVRCGEGLATLLPLEGGDRPLLLSLPLLLLCPCGLQLALLAREEMAGGEHLGRALLLLPPVFHSLTHWLSAVSSDVTAESRTHHLDAVSINLSYKDHRRTNREDS